MSLIDHFNATDIDTVFNDIGMIPESRIAIHQASRVLYAQITAAEDVIEQAKKALNLIESEVLEHNDCVFALVHARNSVYTVITENTPLLKSSRVREAINTAELLGKCIDAENAQS